MVVVVPTLKDTPCLSRDALVNATYSGEALPYGNDHHGPVLVHRAPKKTYCVRVSRASP